MIVNQLHNHTAAGSLLDGLVQPKDLVKAAVADGATAVSATEHGNMFSAFKMAQACREAGIKYIPGIEVYVCDDITQKGLPPDVQKHAASLPTSQRKIYTERMYKELRVNKRNHLCLFALNNVGLKNLFAITSKSYTDGFYKYPRVDYKMLKEHSDGVLGSSACIGGDIYKNREDSAELARVCETYMDIFGRDNFYVELMMHGEPTNEFNEFMFGIAKHYGWKTLATNDVHYLNKEDSYAQKILVAANRNVGSTKKVTKTTMLTDEFFSYPPELYYKKSAEMCALFAGYDEALYSTIEIAERCEAVITTENKYPKFELPDGHTPMSWLVYKIRQGVNTLNIPKTKTYIDRMSYELNVIKKTGFEEYFLVMADIVEYAMNSGVYVGVGRGSGAGSLVAYAIGITGIDPVKYGLAFERFLNSERVSPPDFDVDFADDQRAEVVEYIKRKYGDDRVMNIGAFGTLAARAAIKDVGSVLEYNFQDLNVIANAVPKKPVGLRLNRRNGDLPSALELSKDLATYKESNAELFKIAEQVEGCSKNASIHASGILISPGPVTDYVPVGYRPKDGLLYTQWDKKDIEAGGLLKADILGIVTLRVLRDTVAAVKERHGVEINVRKLNMEDPDVWEHFKIGDTIGVFQFESRMMRGLLKAFKTDSLSELSNANAIGRPGPLLSGVVKMYENRRNGTEEIIPFHPKLQDVFSNTCGLMVYQEQLLATARILSGFTLGEADDLRKAVGKKDHEKLTKLQEKFVSGAVANGVLAEEATKAYEDIKFFGQYGFCVSHACSYAYLAYQTCYMKHHYTIEYMCALLNSEKEYEQIGLYVAECIKLGINVLPPDLHASEIGFSIEGDAIRYGLRNIKGVGETAIEAIMNAKREGKLPKKIRSFIVWATRTNGMDKTAIEALIQAGALDFMGHSRSSMELFYSDVAKDLSKILSRERRDTDQMTLFDMKDAAKTYMLGCVVPKIPNTKDFLRLEMERTGVLFSKNFMAGLSGGTVFAPLSEIDAIENGTVVKVGGLIIKKRDIVTKKGDPMSFVSISDGAAMREVVVFPRTFEKFKPTLTEFNTISVDGKVDGEKIIADNIISV